MHRWSDYGPKRLKRLAKNGFAVVTVDGGLEVYGRDVAVHLKPAA